MHKRILAVRNDRFGEFLLNIPAFRALKQSFPEAKLTLVVDPYVKEIAQCIDFLDEVITWENKPHKLSEILKFSRALKAKSFDLCVILNPSKEFNLISFFAGIPLRCGYSRKWAFLLNRKIEDKKYLGRKHEIEYNLDLVNLAGASTQDKSLVLRIEERVLGGLIDLNRLDLENLAVVHPFTSDPLKQWPLENFQELAQRLVKELNKKVLIIGGREERERSRELFGDSSGEIINLTGKTTLVQLAALLKKCRLLISGDSGPVHLAACVGTPVVAIFRNDIPGKNPERWGPWGRGHQVIAKPGLSQISVTEVLEKVKEVFKG